MKKFNLKKEYVKSLKYLLASKKFIFISMGIFFFFCLIGFLIPAPDSIVNLIRTFIQELLRETENFSHSEMVFFIISNNLKSTFFGIFLGVLFGIFPVLSAIMNGYLLGFVSMMSVGNSGFLSLFNLLPHGIFELPAIFISLGLGLRLGYSFFKEKKKIKENLVNSFRIFLLIILPLLIIAGIIEGTLIFLN
jgi:stage II sporulation protein M